MQPVSNTGIPWEEKRVRYNEAAEICGISSQTLRIYTMQRKGPAFSKIGRSVVFKVGDLLEWLDSQKVKK